MPLNLLSDPWIPTFRNGDPATIRPDQIAEPGITRLAWERADFNLACLELLIGLVSMATPPPRGTMPNGIHDSSSPMQEGFGRLWRRSHLTLSSLETGRVFFRTVSPSRAQPSPRTSKR